MERSSGSAGGSTYYADMVVEAVAESGFELAAGMAGLDFGCSSGRVVRVLAAAYPEMTWHGCDPLAEAIDWAQANLPGVRFERSPEHPPLPYADESLDLVFAISIWSHFGEGAALNWLAEMQRILRPGGRLVLTTHGAPEHRPRLGAGLRQPAQLEQIERALYSDGFWFVERVRRDRRLRAARRRVGNRLLLPGMAPRNTSGAWRVCAFHPGRVQDNQDLYVLEPARPMASVSVVIPVLNGEAELAATAWPRWSARAPDEILVIDSGSTRPVGRDRARAPGSS